MSHPGKKRNLMLVMEKDNSISGISRDACIGTSMSNTAFPLSYFSFLSDFAYKCLHIHTHMLTAIHKQTHTHRSCSVTPGTHRVSLMQNI